MPIKWARHPTATIKGHGPATDQSLTMSKDTVKTGSKKSPHRRQVNNSPRLVVALVLAALMTIAAMVSLENITFEILARKLFLPLARLIILISIGLAAGQLVEALGWTKRLAALSTPLLSFGRLGPHCSAAFTAAFFSGTTANAMLLEFYRSGRITRRQVFVANLINQVPAYFLHLPTTVFIVLPLTGKAGAAYFVLTFAALLLRTIFVLAYGRFFLAPSLPGAQKTGNRYPTGKKPAGLDRHTFIRRLAARLAAVITYVIPIYAAVFVVTASGGFALARRWLAHFLTDRFVPVEALSLVIVGFAAEFTSGFATAGALMHSGVLNVKQATLALLAGNIIAFPIRALRHQLPRLMGIFAPRMGLQILFLGQGLRIASLVLVGFGYWLLG